MISPEFTFTLTKDTTAEQRAEADKYRVTCIKEFNEAGFCLFPLIPGQKEPAVKWRGVLPGEYHEKNLQGNYGIVLKAGDLVIDVDPRNGGEGSFIKLLKDIGESAGYRFPSFVTRTGAGGQHIFFSKPADLNIKKHHSEYPGIDFLSSGCYVVAAGSIHPKTSNVYEILRGSPDGILDAPESLLSLIFKPATSKEALAADKKLETDTNKEDEGTKARFITYLKEVAPVAIAGAAGDETAFKVCCAGRDVGLSESTTFSLVSEHWNPRCLPPWSDEELKDKAAHAYKYASGIPGSKHPANDFEGIPASAQIEAKKQSGGDILDWHMDAKNEKPLKCLHNLLLHLRLPKSPLMKLFGFNEFTGQIEVTSPAPWHNGKMPNSPGIVDHDLKLLKAHLAKTQNFEVPVAIIEEGITVTAYENRFHPVREYLEGLVWDGVNRLDTWLSDYAGAADNDYTRACARKTLCAAVARVLKPGCKFDHILVLEGEQDTGKSRLCAALGGDFYGDFVLDPHNKDTIQNLQGKWIVEMSEMEVTRRSDINALKAFITRTTDKARLAYQRLSSDFPRQCIFIGTINPEADGAWLKDDTGNRRFWPVEQTGVIDVAGIKAIRSQLFAEAVEALKRGEQLYMDSKPLKDLARAEAAERHAEHSWTECISIWLSGLKKGERDFVTARDVFLEALQGTDKTLSVKETKGIAVVMKSLGWKKTVKNLYLTGCTRGYTRPIETTVTQDDLSLLGDLV